MTTVDHGHVYSLLPIDGTDAQALTFVKREGPGYPGNIGHHSGTNCQSVIRALCDRVRYLQNQIPHPNNLHILDYLMRSNWLLEQRAAERHGLSFNLTPEQAIEMPMCPVCGHVVCRHISVDDKPENGHSADTAE